jgi:heptosyltransferase-2/heptosyltransferase-3
VPNSLRDRLVRLLFPPRHPAPLAGPPRRIVIIRPDHLGDLLFATPALVRLRAAYPDARLTGLVGPWAKPIWDRQTMLDDIGELPFPGITARPARPWAPYAILRNAARELRARHYDMAVVLRFDYWWGALLAEQADIPVRWGYDLPETARFLTHTVPYQPGRHEVEQDLALVEAVVRTAPHPPPPPLIDRAAGQPPLRFPLTAKERTWASEQASAGMGSLVAIHPGTNGSLKLWTLAGWAAVIEWLHARGYRIVFTGSAGEIPLVEAIRARLQPATQIATLSLAGQTSLGQLGALFAVCAAVLGVDSGPLHLATAEGAHTLRLYGPSNERLWGPWGPAERNIVVRAPGTAPGHFLDPDRRDLEGGPEMQAITPIQVIAALAGLLGESNG